MGNFSFISKYSVAPYNFISLPSKSIDRYKGVNELVGHNELDDNLLNGYIEYEIENITPLLVGKGNKQREPKEFFKNVKNEYCIPGSTVRGFISNNLATLGLSDISSYITDERFLYRGFGKGSLNKDYKHRLDIKTKVVNEATITAPFTMKGGFIYKVKKNDYALIPTKELNGHTYFIISEQYLRRINPQVRVNYMYSQEILKLISDKEAYKGEDNKKKKKFFLNSIKNRNYQPYCTEVSFEIKNKRNISKIDKPGVLTHNGYLLSSDKIDGKLAHYIIPVNKEDSNIIRFNIENKNIKFIDYYNDDCIRTKKTENKHKNNNFFMLPDDTGKKNGKAIFYGYFNDMCYFGFSPYVRIPYDKSIHNGINESYKNHTGICYLDAIMGFATKDNQKAYKGRVSFEDAIIKGDADSNKEYNVVPGEPHASAYSLYLKQNSNSTTKEVIQYNNNFEIRGIKQYWPRRFVSESLVNNLNMNTRIKPVNAGSKFKGKIHYKNLNKDELGLLLWSLQVNEDCYETIGYAKAYGFGTVKLRNIKVYKENIKEKYTSMVNDYLEEANKEELIENYKTYVKEHFNIDIENHPSVLDMKIIKNTIVNKSNENLVRYMSISFDRDYPNCGTGKNEFNELLPLLTPKGFVELVSGEIALTKTQPKTQSNTQNKSTNTQQYNKQQNYQGNQPQKYADNKNSSNNRDNYNSKHDYGSVGSSIRITTNNRKDKK